MAIKNNAGATVTVFDRALEIAKSPLGWLLANGQTMRWATEKVVIRGILGSREFKGFFESRPHLDSLDVGCAGGRYLLDFLVTQSKAVVGVEYSADHVELARKRISQAGLTQSVKIHQGSAEDLPLKSGSMDFVLCTQVLEHLPHPDRGVAEIARVLRPGGRGLLSIPIPPDPIRNPEHLHQDFFPSNLDLMVEEQDLRVTQRAYCAFAVSRAVAWLVGSVRIPLPLNPLCRLEQAASKLFSLPNPHIYICVIEKNA